MTTKSKDTKVKKATKTVAENKATKTKLAASKVVTKNVAAAAENIETKSTATKKTAAPKASVQPLVKPFLFSDLTDDDILKMPESEYMNDLQLRYFKSKLEQLKNRLLTSAGKTTDNLREEAAVFPDPTDRATVEEEHALELRTRDRERKLLKKVEQSIARIESGEYGYCDETGEAIGIGRLLARPTASLSIEAQQRRELKQKMFGN